MLTVYRNTTRTGHCCETEIDLGNCQVLSITTSKGQASRVDTRASVCTVKGNSRVHVFGAGGEGDFYNKVMTNAAKRVTEKVVREQHAAALLQIDAIKHAAQMHYYNQEQRKAQAHA